MTSLGILTCERFPNLLEADQEIISLLKSQNIKASPLVWNDNQINWHEFDALLFRSTWDYYKTADVFIQWLHAIKSMNIPTINEIDTIIWNVNKNYLKELQEKAVNIIPTEFISTSPDFNLDFIHEKSWKECVIKPSISAGSFYTKRFSIEDISSIENEYKSLFSNHTLLIQEYEQLIETKGETSLIFFDKQFSHSIIKTPKQGDFRIQTQFGGQYTLYQPPTNVIEAAYFGLSQINENLCYARVDGIEKEDQFYIMEIELIEPDLYLQYYPEAKKMFVSSIVKNLKSL
jgi:glutathione synthase/RimK-type ligase-like ATP-grasp enzyme